MLGRRGVGVSVLAATLLGLPGVGFALRIADCPGGRFVPLLNSAVGLPFEDPSSASGSFTVAGGTITLGACPEAPAPFITVRHQSRWRARWDSCASFVEVRLRVVIGPGGGDCGYVVGVIRYRDATGRRRAIKFPAELAAP